MEVRGGGRNENHGSPGGGGDTLPTGSRLARRAPSNRCARARSPARARGGAPRPRRRARRGWQELPQARNARGRSRTPRC